MVRGLAAVVLAVIAAGVWFARWTEAEGKRFAQEVPWGQVLRSPAALTTPPGFLPPLPYRIESQPPWLEGLSMEDIPARRFGLPPPQPEGSPSPPFRQTRAADSRASAPVLKPADSIQIWVESLLPGILESTLPAFIQVSMDQLDKCMEAAGETELARRFTEKEFNRVVVRAVERRSRGQLSEVTARIENGGFSGSGLVNLGPQKFVVSAKLSVNVWERKPHVVLSEMRVGSLEVSGPTLRILERQINRFIDGQRYPLALKEFQSGNGSVWMSVERT